MTYDVTFDGKSYRVELNLVQGRWSCRLDGEPVEVDAVQARPDVLSILLDGAAYEIKRERTPSDLHLWVKNSRFQVAVSDPRSLRSRQSLRAAGEGPQKLTASMPGKVVRLLVSPNAEVEAGQAILVVEAMKMQNELKSPKKGVVKRILATEGAAVNAGDVLAIVE